MSGYSTGTTHGSPYLYDRAVPIVFWGAGVAPGRSEEPAFTVDIAPTLARRLGVAAPADLDGRALFE
jgi:arylsulfatase A-like enzyme